MTNHELQAAFFLAQFPMSAKTSNRDIGVGLGWDWFGDSGIICICNEATTIDA